MRVSSGTFCESEKGQQRSSLALSIRRGACAPGDIRSENADMSNENHVKNTIACQFQGFCVRSIYAE